MKITLLASWLLCSTSLTFAQPGTLDNTFGAGGKVTTLVGGSGNHCHAYATAIQPDGKILIAGYIVVSVNGTNHYGVARLNTNGTVDTNFQFGADGIIHSVGLQSDGKILLTIALDLLAVRRRRRVEVDLLAELGRLNWRVGTTLAEFRGAI